MDKKRTKAFLTGLYGREPGELASGTEDDMEAALARGRGLLERWGRPNKWVGVHSRLRFGAGGDRGAGGGWMAVVDVQASTPKVGAVAPLPVVSADPRLRLVEQANEYDGLGRKYAVIVFKIVRPADIVCALCAAYSEGADAPGAVLSDAFEYRRYLRERVFEHILLPYVRIRGGRGSDWELWKKAVEEVFPARGACEAPVVDTEDARQEFYAGLLGLNAPLRERLAVERVNVLFNKGYRYGVGGRRRMSWRLGEKGTKALQRAARRFLEMREGKE